MKCFDQVYTHFLLHYSPITLYSQIHVLSFKKPESSLTLTFMYIAAEQSIEAWVSSQNHIFEENTYLSVATQFQSFLN